jgi:hypothetical protein
LVDVLQHIILAHHGTYEFGSPRTPSTPEAIAVHALENMDAKLMMSLGATRDGEGAAAEGNWTEYMKAFSGKLYRPDVAPADMNGEEATAIAAPVSEPIRPVAPAPIPKPAPPSKPMLTNPLFESTPPRKS